MYFNFYEKEILIEHTKFYLKRKDFIVTMYFYNQQRSFWNRYNVAWPCQHEPSSIQNLLTAAVCSVRKLRYQVIWIYLYLYQISEKCNGCHSVKQVENIEKQLQLALSQRALSHFPHSAADIGEEPNSNLWYNQHNFFGNCSVLLLALSKILDGTQRSKLCVCRRNWTDHNSRSHSHTKTGLIEMLCSLFVLHMRILWCRPWFGSIGSGSEQSGLDSLVQHFIY